MCRTVIELRDDLRQGADFIKIMGGGGVASPTDRIDQLQFSDEEIRAIAAVAKNAGIYVTSQALLQAGGDPAGYPARCQGG